MNRNWIAEQFPKLYKVYAGSNPVIGLQVSKRKVDMPQENERKWLLKSDVLLPLTQHVTTLQQIQQYYLSSVGEMEIRLRNQNGSYLVGMKVGQPPSRLEIETAVSFRDFMTLKEHAVSSLSKTRFIIGHRLGNFEIDVYHEPLAGLIIAELEFLHPDDMTATVNFPDWLAPFVDKEVTGLSQYKNANLAIRASQL